MTCKYLSIIPFLVAGPALGEEPAPVDVSSAKDKLRVVGDGKRHFVVFVPFAISDDLLFFGDGKTFWQQRTFSGGRDGEKSFSRCFWEPRVKAPYQASFQLRDATYTLQCDERKTTFAALPEAEGRAMIEAAAFHKPRWTHRAYALARDTKGNYYYVDKVREPESSKSFRLWVGPKGRMKPQKMTNVVSDSEGDIFATKTGHLRLVLDKTEATWIAGKAQTRLLSLPVEDNAQLVYTELGVYTGEPLGTPCDDL